jgi:hypothetical protein
MAYAIFRKTPIQGGKAISVRNVPGFGKRMTGTSNSNSGGVSYSAHGDSDFPQVQYIQFLDNGTLLATPFAGTATATNQFGDAMGTVHASHTAWIANNAPRRLTFSTTNFDIKFGSSTAGSTASILNHVRIVQVASATPSGPNILLNNRGNSQIQLTPLGVGNSIMIIR